MADLSVKIKDLELKNPVMTASATDLLELDEFAKIGKVCITTEDGSAGEVGFVTNHSVLENEKFDMISTCGPKRRIQPHHPDYAAVE